MLLFHPNFVDGFAEAGLVSLAIFGIYYVYQLTKQQQIIIN